MNRAEPNCRSYSEQSLTHFHPLGWWPLKRSVPGRLADKVAGLLYVGLICGTAVEDGGLIEWVRY
jgi:hypothetical protein